MEPCMPSGETVISRQQHGFTYIGVLITVAIIGTTLAATGEVWHTAQQRQRERELLFIGDQIRQAIRGYYKAGVIKEYPQNLDDLLRDPRQPGVVRHLRKRYHDPITSLSEWGLVKDANDRIMGVFSLSEERPIKQANFSAAYREFEGKEKYSEWQFIYQPKRARLTQSGRQLHSEAPATEPETKK